MNTATDGACYKFDMNVNWGLCLDQWLRASSLEEIMFELKLEVSKTFIRAAVLTVWSLGPQGSMRKT